jgi:hypothetical protein
MVFTIVKTIFRTPMAIFTMVKTIKPDKMAEIALAKMINRQYELLILNDFVATVAQRLLFISMVANNLFSFIPNLFRCNKVISRKSRQAQGCKRF